MSKKNVMKIMAMMFEYTGLSLNDYVEAAEKPGKTQKDKDKVLADLIHKSRSNILKRAEEEEECK